MQEWFCEWIERRARKSKEVLSIRVLDPPCFHEKVVDLARLVDIDLDHLAGLATLQSTEACVFLEQLFLDDHVRLGEDSQRGAQRLFWSRQQMNSLRILNIEWICCKSREKSISKAVQGLAWQIECLRVRDILPGLRTGGAALFPVAVPRGEEIYWKLT